MTDVTWSIGPRTTGDPPGFPYRWKLVVESFSASGGANSIKQARRKIRRAWKAYKRMCRAMGVQVTKGKS